MSTPAKPNATKHAEPWYRDGLKFQCSGCGNCCTGEPGFVWLNQAEIDEMAAEVGMAAEAFEAEYVRPVGLRRSLIEHDNGDCVFFDPNSRGCRVYSARPRQCRTWPFWDSNLQSPEAWEATCQACPGSGVGKLHQLESIDAQRKVIHI